MRVFQLVEIKAGFTDLVFSQLVEEFALLFQLAVEVEREVLFARGESDVKPIAFARLAAVMKGAKSHHGLAPHFGSFLGERLHELHHLEAIGLPLFIGDGIEELIDVGFSSHGVSATQITGNSKQESSFRLPWFKR